MKRLLGYTFCLPALLMPSRMRVLYTELLAWIMQVFRGLYRVLFEFLLRQLVKGRTGRKPEGGAVPHA